MVGAIFVGLGGFLGSILRYTIGLIPFNSSFPLITLCINVLGAFFLGFITALFEFGNYNRNFVLFSRVGLAGGFTTFSTFSHEVMVLFDEDRHLLGLSYALISVICCIVFIHLGRAFAYFLKG